MSMKIVISCLLVVLAITEAQAAALSAALMARYVCRSRVDGFKAIVPGSCSQYYECFDGRAEINTCPHYYDAIKQKCVYKNPGCVEHYSQPLSCKGPCCGISDGNYAVNAKNPAEYYLCKNYMVAEKRTCKNGQMFDLIKLECSSPSNCIDCNSPKPPCVTTTCTTTTCKPTTIPCSTKRTTCSTTTTCEPITTPCSTEKTSCSTERTTCSTTTTCEPITTPCSTEKTTCSTERTTCSTTTTCKPITTPCSTEKTPCSTERTTCSTTTTCKPITTPCSTEKTPCSTERTTCSTTTTCEPITTPCSTEKTTCSTERTTCSTTTTCEPITTPCSTEKTPCSTQRTTCSTTTCKPTTKPCSSKITTCSTTTCSTETTKAPCSTIKAPCTSTKAYKQPTFDGDNKLPDVHHYILPLKMSRKEVQDYIRYSCTKKPEGFLLPSLTKCNEYFICRNGRALPVSCGRLYFDVKKGTCDLPTNTNCIQAE